MKSDAQGAPDGARRPGFWQEDDKDRSNSQRRLLASFYAATAATCFVLASLTSSLVAKACGIAAGVFSIVFMFFTTAESVIKFFKVVKGKLNE